MTEDPQGTGGSKGPPQGEPNAQRGYGGKPPANVQKPVNLPPPPPSSNQPKDKK